MRPSPSTRVRSLRLSNIIIVLTNEYITKLVDVPRVGGKNEKDKYYDFDLQVKIV